MQWYISGIRESQKILVYISSMRELLKSLAVLINLKAHMDSKPWSFLYLRRHIRKVPRLLEPTVAQPSPLEPMVAQPGLKEPMVVQPGLLIPMVGQPGLVKPMVANSLKCTLGFLRGSLILDAFNVPQSDVSPQKNSTFGLDLYLIALNVVVGWEEKQSAAPSMIYSPEPRLECHANGMTLKQYFFSIRAFFWVKQQYLRNLHMFCPDWNRLK